MPCECVGMDRYDDIRLSEELNIITQNLCYLCGELSRCGNLGIYANGRILAWWKNHQENDTKRVTEKMEKYYRQHKPCTPEQVTSAFIAKAEAVHPVSEFHMKWFLELAKDIYERRLLNKQAEQRKKEVASQAKAKLSDEERKALGL